MATQADVRRIALSLPETTEGEKEMLIASDPEKFFTEVS
jgi:hypothetical protein